MSRTRPPGNLRDAVRECDDSVLRRLAFVGEPRRGDDPSLEISRRACDTAIETKRRGCRRWDVGDTYVFFGVVRARRQVEDQSQRTDSALKPLRFGGECGHEPGVVGGEFVRRRLERWWRTERSSSWSVQGLAEWGGVLLQAEQEQLPRMTAASSRNPRRTAHAVGTVERTTTVSVLVLKRNVAEVVARYNKLGALASPDAPRSSAR